jgi:hypothetical protein
MNEIGRHDGRRLVVSRLVAWIVFSLDVDNASNNAHSEHANRCEYVALSGVVECIEVALGTRSLITDEQLERFEGDEPIESLEVVRCIEVSELGVHIDVA